MKKTILLVSLVVMASLLFAACGGTKANETATPEVMATSASSPTPQTGVTAVSGTQMTATTGADLTPTVVELDATPVAETAVPGPLAKGASLTGIDVERQADRLTSLLAFNVRNQMGVKIGEVQGMLVSRSMVISTNIANAVNPDATAAAATPTADDTTAPIWANDAGGAQVRYLIIELSDGFFADDTGSAAVVTTPAAGSSNPLVVGDEVLVPLAAFAPYDPAATADDDPALVLNVDPVDMANAPVFNRDVIDFTTATWDANVRAFWTGLGVDSPADEAVNTAANSAMVLFGDNFTDINAVNAKNDDLGDIVDFIIDPTTGVFRYAILAKGGILGVGETYTLIPMPLVHWAIDQDAAEKVNVDEVGYVLINVSEDALNNAPSFDGLDRFDTSTDQWNSDIDSYWMNILPAITK